MTKKVITVKKNDTVHEIFKTLANNNIMGVPVVHDDKIVGIVTERDLVIREEDISVPPSINLIGSVVYLQDLEKFDDLLKKKFGQLATDVMTSPALTLQEHSSLKDILNFMEEHRINRVPILDKDEKLSGIITRTDIIKEMIREGKDL